MRDINRIKTFLKTLETAWETVPDWRFGQLMMNFLGQLGKDPFFYEEDEMEKELIKFFNLKIEKEKGE